MTTYVTIPDIKTQNPKSSGTSNLVIIIEKNNPPIRSDKFEKNEITPT